MSKGRSSKLKGAICNVPVNGVDVSTTLPRPTADNNKLAITNIEVKIGTERTCFFWASWSIHSYKNVTMSQKHQKFIQWHHHSSFSRIFISLILISNISGWISGNIEVKNSMHCHRRKKMAVPVATDAYCENLDFQHLFHTG